MNGDQGSAPLRHPLTWPLGWPRCERRTRARFRVAGVTAAARQVLHELRRLGAREILISTNVAIRLEGLPYAGQKIPADPGAAVYFKLDGRPAVLACDTWDIPDHNLVAIAKHVEAIRGQARWGVGTLEQAFTGYLALPPARNGATARPWREVLEVEEEDGPPAILAAYRRLAKVRHPDTQGGTAAAFQELRRAYEDGMLATGGTP